MLGIGLFESDADVIEGAADRQMAHVRAFQTGQHSVLPQKILNELAAAKLCLLSQTRKATYDDDVSRHGVGQPPDRQDLDRTFVDREAASVLQTTVDLAKPAPWNPGGKPWASTPQVDLPDHPDYETVRELGRGGMGVVYLARNRLMDRLEVLKVLKKSLLERPGALERFQKEIRAAAKLSHVNIVAAHAVLRLGDSLAFAMEYVPGQDLAMVVERRGELRVPNAAYYAHQAALGMQHAHEKGMVHRDIKPNNLMLAVDGKKHIIKILDFGLAKATSEKFDETSLTKSGQILGTPDYLAPEQSRDAQGADIRADIYSLGCTLYFLLTGKRPFPESSLYDVLDAHQKRLATPVDELRHEVPRELTAVVAKMMAKSPGDRYQTPLEVARAMLPFFKPCQAAAAPGDAAAGRVPALASQPPVVIDGSVSIAPAPWPIWQIAMPAGPPHAVPVATPASTSAFDTAIEFETPLVEAEDGLRSAMRRWPLYLATCAGAVAIMLAMANIVRNQWATVETEPTSRNATTPGLPRSANDATGSAQAPDEAPVKPVRAPATKRFPCRIDKQFRNDWSIDGDELVQSSVRRWPSLRFGDAQEGDYDFSVEIKRIAGNDVVVLGFGGENKGFFYGLGAANNTQHDTGYAQSGKLFYLGKRKASLKTAVWYRAEVRVRGDKYECFLDGKKLFDPKTKGMTVRKWALSANRTAFRFRNILVKAPDGKVLVEGLPELENGLTSATANKSENPSRPVLALSGNAAATSDGWVPFFNQPAAPYDAGFTPFLCMHSTVRAESK